MRSVLQSSAQSQPAAVDTQVAHDLDEQHFAAQQPDGCCNDGLEMACLYLQLLPSASCPNRARMKKMAAMVAHWQSENWPAVGYFF